ncbi:hypothetical protein PVK06_030239 [Gossypium arboreum]|uniref:Uncharacterized protein n=1 Tax=Gossypium arboreum TaxID=29729 RepID=A0ABR0NNU0_GOSAR|nr:hypothetical protein PVK06_030239 [Gossypium arboreum]
MACVHGPNYRPDERVMPYLDAVGFRLATLLRMIEDCTITLEDVALQLKPPIDGYAITGSSKVFELATLCYHLLGRLPGDGEARFMSLKFP